MIKTLKKLSSFIHITGDAHTMLIVFHYFASASSKRAIT